MKYITVFLFSAMCSMAAYGQYKYEDFNKGLPDKWSTTSKTQLTLSSDHYKDGGQSLKWEAKDNDVLTVAPLSISEKATIGHLAAEIFVYSKVPGLDTLIFQFFDNKDQLKREGRMLLNYKGWRAYHRSWQFDYNNGIDQEPFRLDKCRIIYKSEKTAAEKTIYFDAVKFTGDKDLRRQPAPHTEIDRQDFKPIGLAGGDPLGSWLNKPTEGLRKVTDGEAKDIQKLKEIYLKPLQPVDKKQLQEAMAYVKYANIERNQDNSIKGRGILAIAKPDTLVKISGYCGVLARSFLLDKNKEAKDALLLFTEYLIDQGLAEGGRNVLPTNSYYNARNFPLGFMEALGVYPADMRAQILAMLKWSHEYNRIYNDHFKPGINTDFVLLKLQTLIRLALLNPKEEETARDLKYISRFFEQSAAISQGGNDGIKPDGIGFHHHSAHMSYMSAFSAWIDHAYSFKGTSFRISKPAYENMRLAVRSLLLETSKGTLMPHALSGRKPFTAGVPVKSTHVEKLIKIGDDLNLHDDEMKAFYNYLYKENKYSVQQADMDGFYQFNYAQLGILRKDNWIAAMRGFTDRMFGAEIYDKQNRFGRYQSCGSLEVLYNGKAPETGYIQYGKGWDWNVMPGTTTVHLPWDRLKAVGATATEFQDKSFAGALSLGKNGVFGLDFAQRSKSRYVNQKLTFRKSVFAFDRILVCLGSNISAETDVGHLATNLFQNVFKEDRPSIYQSNKKISEETYAGSISVDNESTWLINSVHTGYYIPKGNNEIEVIRGEQVTPDYTSNDGKKTNKAWASKAWINHGKEGSGIKYHFTVVPQTTVKEMKDLAARFDNNSIYEILEQTETAHVVRYIPDNLISYVFFEPQENTNIGYVQSVSGACLLGIKDVGDRIEVTMASPDLHAQPNAESYWVSTENTVKLRLSGKWKVIENRSDIAVGNKGIFFEADFNLIHGFPKKIVLKKEN